MSSRTETALRQARRDLAAGPQTIAPDGRPRTTAVAMGDPQAPFETVLAVLDAHGLLGEDGRLKPAARLVSMGDHFDWGSPHERLQATQSALELLAWLAAHPPDQVTLILGNHDLARVGELVSFNEADFQAARDEADLAYRLGDVDSAPEKRFLEKYPMLTSAEILARDFATFHPVQRDWVIALLKSHRFRIAFAATPRLLLCHAGVTRDELRAMGVAEEHWADARIIEAALNDFLARAVARWTEGALDLLPLHRPGDARAGEGRGMFYHRPSHPEHEPADMFEGPPRRRFDPRQLPLGLTQAIGHIRDSKCRKLLHEWAAPGPAVGGVLRHLTTDGATVRYELGTGTDDGTSARLLFLDGGMSAVPPEQYELLDLNASTPAAFSGNDPSLPPARA